MARALPKGSTVAVIGAGAMGAGIAQIAAQNGHPVQLHDTRVGAADAGKRAIADVLGKLVAKGKLAAADADAALARITTAVELADAGVAALVVEAIVEDLAVKRELLASLENVVAADCILASNTSSISITALAAGAKHPQRIVGMHFFNPAPLMPLVEVVSGLATAREVADTIHATAAAWGKTPVHATSTPGFIVNRCARPFYAEGLRLLAERAADPATIDAVMREAGGFRMGPFELMDLIGHDVNFAVTRSVWEAYFHDPRYAPSVVQQELVAAGFHGRKSGRGFFDYASGTVKPEPATETARTRPQQVVVHGELGVAAVLAERLAGAGAALERTRADSRFPSGALHVPGAGGGVWLAPTDGRTATTRVAATGVRDLVLFDLAFDYATATRLAVARADTCADGAYAAAVGTLQAAGLAVSRLDDVAGLAVMRTVTMLANEAADAVMQGVADPAAVDLAMQKGVNYPRGPLAWADAIGLDRVAAVLGHLAAHYGEDRYRTSPLLARRSAAGGSLHG
ncbi:MAG: 3-hydroxyacyl-CoA dehydrogenase PaaH [Betaproteobacteria bacterium]